MCFSSIYFVEGFGKLHYGSILDKKREIGKMSMLLSQLKDHVFCWSGPHFLDPDPGEGQKPFEDMCAICYEDFDPEKNPVAMLGCGHDYCRECVVGWVESSGNFNCPYCRSEMKNALVKDQKNVKYSKDTQGRSVLQVAAQNKNLSKGHEDCYRLLREHHAKQTA